MGLGLPNVAVLLDGGIRWVPLPTVTAGTEIRRHTAFILGRGWGHCFGQLGEQDSALVLGRPPCCPLLSPPSLTSSTVPGGQTQPSALRVGQGWLALGLPQVRRQAPGAWTSSPGQSARGGGQWWAVQFQRPLSWQMLQEGGW